MEPHYEKYIFVPELAFRYWTAAIEKTQAHWHDEIEIVYAREKLPNYGFDRRREQRLDEIKEADKGFTLGDLAFMLADYEKKY